MRHAVVIEAVRSPIGRAHPEKGMFRDVRADDPVADNHEGAFEMARVPPALIEDIHWGCVKQEKEQGTMWPGWPLSSPAFPLRLAGPPSTATAAPSLQATTRRPRASPPSARTCRLRGASSNAPHPHGVRVQSQPPFSLPHGPGDTQHGLTAENLAMRYRIGRREQDRLFLAQSSPRRRPNLTAGLSRTRSSPPGGAMGRPQANHEEDECIRRDSSLEALSALKPVFMPDGGTVTAGNSVR